MDFIRRVRQLLLLSALMLAVVAMHSLVDTGMSQSAAVGPHHDAHAVTAQTAPIAPEMIVMGGFAPADAGPLPTLSAGPDTPMCSMLMHLCLAVLSALLLLALLLQAGRAAGCAAGDEDSAAIGPEHPAPRRPPPRHAMRQAELCVLRN